MGSLLFNLYPAFRNSIGLLSLGGGGGVATHKKPNATANFKFGTGFFRFFLFFLFVFFVFFFRFFHFGQF